MQLERRGLRGDGRGDNSAVRDAMFGLDKAWVDRAWRQRQSTDALDAQTTERREGGYSQIICTAGIVNSGYQLLASLIYEVVR